MPQPYDGSHYWIADFYTMTREKQSILYAFSEWQVKFAKTELQHLNILYRIFRMKDVHVFFFNY